MIVQVVPSVPPGTVMVKGSEDDPCMTSPASTEASPKEIAKQITSLLSNKGIAQRLFAEKVLNRSQGSFSNYLSKDPAEMPKTHSWAIWFKLKDFLESQEQQQELMQIMKTSKYCLMSLLLYHKQRYNLAKCGLVSLSTGETCSYF